MHKSDRTAAGCTVEDEPYKLLERDAEKSILAGPLRFPPGQLPFSTSLKAPVPFTHDAVTAPVMDGNVLMPPSCTLIAPFGDEGEDGSKFYRFTGDAWAAELKPTCAADLVGVVVSHHSQTPHDIEMRSLIQKFAQEEGYREKRGEDLSWSVEKIPEKTPEEKLAETEEEVRSKRDRLIADTDYLLMNDYPISEEDLAVVKAYRTALRDVPQQEGFPYEVVWPEVPSVLNRTTK